MELKKYQEFCDLFSQAEKKLKQVENLIDQLAIPAVNELRYAGFHCACSLAATTEKEAEDHLDSARKHCKRAIFDAMEIGVCYFLVKIRMFKDDYRLVPVTNVVKDYVDYLQQVRTIQDFVASHNRHAPEAEWETIQKHFDTVSIINGTLDAARPELNKTLQLWRIGIIVSILSLFVAIIKLFL